jgi:hypothetical protein
MNRIKLLTIFSVLVLVGIIADNSRQFTSAAKDDEVLSEIAKYKSWQSVNKTDEKLANGTFIIRDSSSGGG